MPFRAPRLCGCGRTIFDGARCACEVKRDFRRKAAHDANRPTARQRGYDARWDRERAAFLKANPKCRNLRCDEPAKVVDHIIPHKGDMRLFWDRSNWQSLCVRCHSKHKQALERRAAREPR